MNAYCKGGHGDAWSVPRICPYRSITQLRIATYRHMASGNATSRCPVTKGRATRSSGKRYFDCQVKGLSRPNMGFFSAFKRSANQSSVIEGAYNRSLSLFPQKPDHSQDGEEFPAPASAALSAKSFSYASVVKVCTLCGTEMPA